MFSPKPIRKQELIKCGQFVGLLLPVALLDVRVYIHHEVTDYSAWRKVYDAFAGTQRKLGVTRKAVYQSVENPNDVTVTHDFKTKEKAKAFMSAPEVKSK